MGNKHWRVKEMNLEKLLGRKKMNLGKIIERSGFWRGRGGDVVYSDSIDENLNKHLSKNIFKLNLGPNKEFKGNDLALLLYNKNYFNEIDDAKRFVELLSGYVIKSDIWHLYRKYMIEPYDYDKNSEDVHFRLVKY